MKLYGHESSPLKPELLVGGLGVHDCIRSHHGLCYGQFSNQESLNLEFESSKFLNEGGGFS